MRIKHMLLHRRILSAATALVVLLAMVSSAAAITREEVVALTKAGLGDEVIVNKIQADRSTFTLSTDDILNLKKDGVSDRVLAAMIQTQIAAPSAAQPAAPQPELSPADDPSGSANPRRFPAPENASDFNSEVTYSQPVVTQALPRRATVLFSNQSSTDLAISVDAITRTLYFRLPSSNSTGTIPAGSQRTFSMEPGIYGARWYGSGSVQNVAIGSGTLTKFITSTLYDNGASGLGLTILSGDAVISSGMLYSSRPPFRVVERTVIQPAPVCAPVPTVTRCETDYYPGGSTTTCETYSSGYGSPVIYESRRPVYVRQPVYCEQPRYYYEQPRRQGSLLGSILTPNTVLYGGIGAIIGHNTIKRHGTEKGLLYGALLGQFLDR